jgi:hypothetical protein
MKLEEPRDIGRRLDSRLDHGDGPAALIGGEFRSPFPGPAFGARCGQSTARARGSWPGNRNGAAFHAGDLVKQGKISRGWQSGACARRYEPV